jgi:hypothetical protein
MKSLRDRVMAYPPEDRLDVALMLLDELSGEDRLFAALMRRFGLTALEARLIGAISVRAPAVATKQAIYAAIYGDACGPDLKIIDVMICKIRKKMPGVVSTAWGRGYYLLERIDVAKLEQGLDPLPDNVTRMVPHGQHLKAPWTAEDDAELLRMVSTKSSWAAIEDELGRSRRACQYRLGCLASKRLRVAHA